MISNLEIENKHLLTSLKELTEKYESLRDVDSPVKEVSTMKKILKDNDKNVVLLKEENNSLQKKLASLEKGNAQLIKNLKDINDKYESLRDVDSPIKEVSQIKKVLKQNDEKSKLLVEENKHLNEKIKNYLNQHKHPLD